MIKVNFTYIFFLLLLGIFIIQPSLHAQFTDFHPELNWFSVQGKHCIVHYHEGAERTALTVAKIADEVWSPITSLYDYEPETVHFIIKDIDDYSNGATYFFDNKIEIWSSALDFELRGFHNWLRNVITHEFTHMVQIQASLKTKRTLPAVYLQYLGYEDERRPNILYGFPNAIVSYPFAMVNMPSWFAEGTAQFMRSDLGYDTWDSQRDMILRSYALDNNMLTWNQMGVFEKTSLGNESVYNSGFALTRYISQRYGEDKLEKITHALGKMKNFTFDAACSDVLGISGRALYDEWSTYVKEDYKTRTAKIKQNEVKGEMLFSEGFGNFSPIFWNNSDTILFISNKGQDYLGHSAIYMMNVKDKKEKLIIGGIRSTLARIPGENKIIYAKLTEDNPGWANVHDLFVYDLQLEKETRLTNSMRANQPSISPDGKTIVFTFQKDGTGNLGIVNNEGKEFRQITFYQNGEQVFNPIFSPDGKEVVFDFAYSEGRDICKVSLTSPRVMPLIATKDDERNPVFSKDGRLIYCSDKTGISNLYSYNLVSGETKQLTNVLGGAFMPAIDARGNIVYAGYTSGGYKLFYLPVEQQQTVSDSAHYEYKMNPPIGKSNPKKNLSDYELNLLRNYNDSAASKYTSVPYKGKFTKLTIFPVVRVDNYNTSNNFLEKIKPGAYFMSSDMLNRYSLFGGGTINTRFERDLFLSFDYRNRLPGLFDLGIKPELTLELYSVSRKAPTLVEIDEYPSTHTDVTYNLFEVDVLAKHRIFSRGNTLTLKYSFSRYSASLGSFLVPTTSIFSPEFTDTYLLASNFEVKYNFEAHAPSVDEDINPVGADIELKLDYELNRYNPDGQYKVDGDVLVPSYQNFDFPRIEINTRFAIPVFQNHTVTLKMRGASILGPQVPDFFDYYLGGMIGMKAYSFYAISGNELCWLNLTYRFPLFRNIDARFGHLYLDKLYMSVFADYGNAWNGSNPCIKDFKKGAGAELRCALTSFYMFPTDVFFSAAYGF
ncbi:MAG: biopolymer transporter Tol, partial [Ignavibacteria bacterium]|nr:biopolymer transporter Tol [Ignavibacteria bacterium]